MNHRRLAKSGEEEGEGVGEGRRVNESPPPLRHPESYETINHAHNRLKIIII